MKKLVHFLNHRRKQRRAQPAQLPVTPEEAARALLEAPPKKADEWRYLNRGRKVDLTRRSS